MTEKFLSKSNLVSETIFVALIVSGQDSLFFISSRQAVLIIICIAGLLNLFTMLGERFVFALPFFQQGLGNALKRQPSVSKIIQSKSPVSELVHSKTQHNTGSMSWVTNFMSWVTKFLSPMTERRKSI